MDASRFDAMTRSLTEGSARREFLRRLAATALGLALARLPNSARAKKRKKKKVKFNAFGCVNVGRFCKNAEQCCSDICEGKKGKKTCKAHDTGGCAVGLTEGFCDGTDVECDAAGGVGVCNTTTGNAAFCTFSGSECDVACTKDAECRAVCGPNAACVKCAVCPSGTSCVGPEDCPE